MLTIWDRVACKVYHKLYWTFSALKEEECIFLKTDINWNWYFCVFEFLSNTFILTSIFIINITYHKGLSVITFKLTFDYFYINIIWLWISRSICKFSSVDNNYLSSLSEIVNMGTAIKYLNRIKLIFIISLTLSACQVAL